MGRSYALPLASLPVRDVGVSTRRPLSGDGGSGIGIGVGVSVRQSRSYVV
jgi:hypothetical protein